MFFKKKAVLLIHGFVGGNYDFGDLINELQVNKNIDVFSFTLPGHDLTIVKDIKYQEWIQEAERQIQFLINHNYKEIYVIGHSMGGVIASYLASTHPQIKKLVLVAPAFGYFSFKDGALDIKCFNDSIKNMKNAIMDETEIAFSRIIKTPISTMMEFTKLVNDYYDSVKDVYCDTLIIRGNDDQIVPKEATDYVYNNIKAKNVCLYNIKEVNHNCFKGQRYNQVIGIIKDFIINKVKQKKETLNI